MGYFEGVPRFVQGQVMSAGGHLSRLARQLQLLFDDRTGLQRAFTGNAWMDNRTWSYEWTGMIRHMGNQLAWELDLWNGDCQIKINDQVVPGTLRTNATSTPQAFSGVANVGGLGLTEGQFYAVRVYSPGGNGRMRTWLLREEGTPFSAALATFADDTTPAVEDWEALTDLVTMLQEQATHARSLVTGSGTGPQPGAAVTDPDGYELSTYAWNGSFWYAGSGLLYYRVKVIAPYNRRDEDDLGDNPTNRWTHADIYIGDVGDADTPVLRLRSGSTITPAPAGWPPTVQHNGGRAGLDHVFTGAIDLAGLGLTAYTDVRIRVRATTSTYWDDFHDVLAEQFSVLPAATPTIPDWVALPAFAYPNYVRGSSGTAKVKTLRDDALALANAGQWLNYPCATGRLGSGQWALRRARYLHYRNEEGKTPKIKYTYNGAQEVSLTDAKDEKKVHDLGTIRNLWPGMEYELTDALWGIEDEEP